MRLNILFAVFIAALVICTYLVFFYVEYAKADLQFRHRLLEDSLIVNKLAESCHNIDIPVFIINLERDHARWKFQEKQHQLLGLSPSAFVRVEAIDGKKLELKTHKDGFDEYLYNNEQDVVVDGAFGFHSRSIIACTLSHATAIATAFNSGAEFAVIAEDDASWILAPRWTVSLANLAKQMPDRTDAFTIDLFSSRWFPAKGPAKGLAKNQNKFSAVAYIINRSAMKKIVDNVMIGNGMRIMRSPSTKRLQADYYIHDVVASRWNIEPSYVYPYNCNLTSTLHSTHDYYHMLIARRVLKRYDKAIL